MGAAVHSIRHVRYKPKAIATARRIRWSGLQVASFELSTVEVESIRKRMADTVTPEQIGRLQELKKTEAHKDTASAGKMKKKRCVTQLVTAIGASGYFQCSQERR